MVQNSSNEHNIKLFSQPRSSV